MFDKVGENMTYGVVGTETWLEKTCRKAAHIGATIAGIGIGVGSGMITFASMGGPLNPLAYQTAWGVGSAVGGSAIYGLNNISTNIEAKNVVAATLGGFGERMNQIQTDTQ